MGTRGTIHIKDGKKTILSLYRQYDCYPTGLGEELKAGFGATQIVNGFSLAMKAPAYANTVQCLAAQIVANQKQGLGHVYITDARDRQEYNYFIAADRDGKLTLRVTNSANVELYNGPLASFNGSAVEASEAC
jgi:hypothetical protein